MNHRYPRPRNLDFYGRLNASEESEMPEHAW